MMQSDTPKLPALARAGIDRAAEERERPDLIELLRADPTTRVLAVHGDRGLIDEASRARLHLVDVLDISTGAQWAFLGRGADGAAVLLAVSGADDDSPLRSVPEGAGWAALRVIGGDLDPVAAGLLVEAVALGRWLVDAPYCPACGARTQLRAAGWARHCQSCGREHFPRTDPAVIVAVQSTDGQRLLLGKNAAWADHNLYSTFAGFVESGESLESAVSREIREEAGVVIADSTYRGSQAWPYRRSLMLGFHATCTPDSIARADGEEIIDVRWFERAELAEALAGRSTDGVRLPGSASIAYRLIVDWVEAAP